MLYFRVKSYDLVFPLCGNLYTMSREDILGTSVLDGSLISWYVSFNFVCFGSMPQAFEKALFNILFLSDVVLQLSMLFFKIGILSMIVLAFMCGQ